MHFQPVCDSGVFKLQGVKLQDFGRGVFFSQVETTWQPNVLKFIRALKNGCSEAILASD